MRGSIEDLAVPHPMGGYLPAIYQESDFSMRFTSAFDTVLAPIVLTLDCQDTYLDPDLSPEDILQWLGGWVGLLLDEDWPVARRRAMVRDIVGLYAERGTVAGVQRLVELYTGASVEVIEGGGSVHSAVPLGALPGSEAAAFVVRVITPDPTAVDIARVEMLVAGSRPAHLPAVVEVVAGEVVERAARGASSETSPDS